MTSAMLLAAVFAVLLRPAMTAQTRRQVGQTFSTNPICRQRNCVNPVFPGFLDLQQLEALTWQCRPHADVKPYLRFCGDVVMYDVAIASPNSSVSLEAIVTAQEQAAATTYFYHLSGLNMEPWALHDINADTDPCARATRMMVCNTYFPKAEAGCVSGQPSLFQRPCKNVCTDYVQACKVECCDESVKCVSDSISLLSDASNTTSGYVDVDGPSAECTGMSLLSQSAAHTSRPSWLLAGLSALLLGSSALQHTILATARVFGGKVGIFSLGLLFVSVSLQGCDIVSFQHETKAWEDQPSYFSQYLYIPPGKPVSDAVLNSCDVPGLSNDLKCSGNGVCTVWNATSRDNVGGKPISFCRCNQGWADPECRTRRKSQFVAFMLSLFGGYLGLDAIYLGNYYTAMGKICTLGGLGVWWVYDIVRIGSSPVYTGTQFRLAHDLGHAQYIFIVTLFAMTLGILIFGIWATLIKKSKKKHKLLMLEEDEFIRTGSATVDENPWNLVGQPTIHSFPLPQHVTVGHGYGAYAVTMDKKSDQIKEDAAFHGYMTRLGGQPQPVYPPSYHSTASYYGSFQAEQTRGGHSVRL